MAHLRGATASRTAAFHAAGFSSAAPMWPTFFSVSSNTASTCARSSGLPAETPTSFQGFSARKESVPSHHRHRKDFIKTLPGFPGHVTFAKSGGPTTFDIVTIAVWESRDMFEKAGEDSGVRQ